MANPIICKQTADIIKGDKIVEISYIANEAIETNSVRKNVGTFKHQIQTGPNT